MKNYSSLFLTSNGTSEFINNNIHERTVDNEHGSIVFNFMHVQIHMDFEPTNVAWNKMSGHP